MDRQQNRALKKEVLDGQAFFNFDARKAKSRPEAAGSR